MRLNWFHPHSSFPTDGSMSIPLLQLFFACASMRRLFCHYLCLIPPSFGTSGELCFVHFQSSFTCVLPDDSSLN